MESSSILDKAVKEDGSEPCTSTQQAQQERYAQCRRRAQGTQTLFTWNRAHWIGMVVLIAVLLLLRWRAHQCTSCPTRSLTGLPKPVRMVPGMVLHWPLVLGITNLILGSIRSGSLSFPVGERNHRTAGIRLYQSSLTAGVPIPFLGSVVEANAH